MTQTVPDAHCLIHIELDLTGKTEYLEKVMSGICALFLKNLFNKKINKLLWINK